MSRESKNASRCNDSLVAPVASRHAVALREGWSAKAEQFNGPTRRQAKFTTCSAGAIGSAPTQLTRRGGRHRRILRPQIGCLGRKAISLLRRCSVIAHRRPCPKSLLGMCWIGQRKEQSVCTARRIPSVGDEPMSRMRHRHDSINFQTANRTIFLEFQYSTRFVA